MRAHTPQPPPLTEQEQEAENQKQLVLVDRSKQQLAIRNQNHQIVLRQNHARQQLAERLGIPLHKPPVIHEAAAAAAATHPKEKQEISQQTQRCQQHSSHPWQEIFQNTEVRRQGWSSTLLRLAPWQRDQNTHRRVTRFHCSIKLNHYC